MTGQVWLVEDDAPVRAALADVLTVEGMNVRTFESAEALLDAVSPDSAGCIVLDVRLPGIDGLQAQSELQQRGVRMPVIFLTGHGDVPMSVRALRGGAHDFLQKPVAAEILLDRVRTALSQDTARRDVLTLRDDARDRMRRLTARELEITRHLLQGRTSKEIGRLLGTSPRTVEAHRRSIMLKTHAANLLELERLFSQATLDDGSD